MHVRYLTRSASYKEVSEMIFMLIEKKSYFLSSNKLINTPMRQLIQIFKRVTQFNGLFRLLVISDRHIFDVFELVCLHLS